MTGAPIKALLSATSKNSKTGNTATLTVIRADVSPKDAVDQGIDDAVCGNCECRKGGIGARCYTHGQMLSKGLRSMYKGLPNRTDRSDWAVEDLGQWLKFARLNEGAQAFRSCAYGDIGALPVATQLKLDDARQQGGLSPRGYTHQWRDPAVQHLKSWHMASVSTLADYEHAKDLGWRAYLAAQPSLVAAVTAQRLLLCPASKEAGHLTTCAQCTLCAGNTRGTAPSVYIPDHGPSARGARVAASWLARKAAQRPKDSV